MSKKRHLVSLSLLVVLGLLMLTIALLSSILSDIVSNDLKEFLKKHFVFVLVLIVALTLSISILDYITKEYDKKKELNYDNDLYQKKVSHIILKLLNDYHFRLKNKLDDRLILNLSFRHSQIDPASAHLSRHFLENATTDDAIQVGLKSIQHKYKFLSILGNAGSGKSTLLLDLALTLLKKAQEEDIAPIPIILSLHSWNKEFIGNFQRYVEVAIIDNGILDKKYVKILFKQKKVILLLDGLDEIGYRTSSKSSLSELQRACLTDINSYLKQYEPQGFIITSRLENLDIAKLATTVWAQITINNISLDSVKNMLNLIAGNVGINSDRYYSNPIAARNILWVMNNRPELAQMLCIPFYFNIASHVFDSSDIFNYLPENPNKFKSFLVKQFIDRSLSDGARSSKIKPNKMQKWLASLARDINDLDKNQWLQPVIYRPGYFNSLSLENLYKNKFRFLNLAFHSTANGIGYVLFFSILGLTQLLHLAFLSGFLTFFSFNVILSAFYLVFFKLNSFKKVSLFKRNIIYNSFSAVFSFMWNIAVYYSIFKVLFHSTGFDLLLSLNMLFFIKNIALLLINLTLQTFKSFNPAKFKSGLYYINLFCNCIIYYVLFTGSAIKIGLERPFFIICIYLTIVLLHIIRRWALSWLFRIAYWLREVSPFRINSFFNAATECRILEKDGRFWRFRHQILQEYFIKIF